MYIRRAGGVLYTFVEQVGCCTFVEQVGCCTFVEQVRCCTFVEQVGCCTFEKIWSLFSPSCLIVRLRRLHTLHLTCVAVGSIALADVQTATFRQGINLNTRYSTL
jgi:hypothetical protein